MSMTDKDIFDQAKLWELPSVDDQLAQEEESTNALNRPRGKWKFEAPEEDKDVEPLTAEDIEEIRAAAFQEGLKSGHEEGLKKGYDEGLDKGTQEGLEQGKSSGIEQGLAEARVSLDEQSKKFEALMSSFEQPIAQLHHEMQKELVLLAKALAEAVIKVESTQSNEVLLKAIEEGLKALPIQESQYQMFLHPSDLQWVNEHFGEQYIAQKDWMLVASDDIEQGGCKIQTPNNTVDVSIQKRCEQIFSKLLFEQGLADDPRSK